MSYDIKILAGIKDEYLEHDTTKEYVENIKGCKILNLVQTNLPIQTCPKCKSRMVKNGLRKPQRILWGRLDDSPLVLSVRKQKFLCKQCGKTMVLPVSGVEPHCFIANKIKQSIIVELSKTKSLKDIAEDRHVSESTIQRQIKSAHDLVSPTYDWLPTMISLDDFSSMNGKAGKMSMLMINPVNHRTIDVIRSRKDFALRAYFGKYPLKVRRQVKFVVVDLYQPYRKLIHDIFPEAVIIADPFHVVTQAYRELNLIRIKVMKQYGSKSREYRSLKKFWKLLLKNSASLNSTNFYPRTNFRHSLLSDSEIVDRLLAMSDELEEAYDYYQTLLTAMHTKNEVLLHKLLQTNYCELPEGFKRVQRTLRKHEREISSSFVIRISNGPIEGKMNKVKVLKRVSYGYRNFNNFRTRILLATKSNKLTITKSKKPTIRKLLTAA